MNVLYNYVCERHEDYRKYIASTYMWSKRSLYILSLKCHPHNFVNCLRCTFLSIHPPLSCCAGRNQWAPSNRSSKLYPLWPVGPECTCLSKGFGNRTPWFCDFPRSCTWIESRPYCRYRSSHYLPHLGRLLRAAIIAFK